MDSYRETLRIRGVSSVVQQAAAEMRCEMTLAESHLWERIRGRRLGGLRFRAQHPVGQFILDFYCPDCKLVIEVDGSSHDREAEQDAARTAQLASYGYWVLRFTNMEVMTQTADVLERIQKAAEAGK